MCVFKNNFMVKGKNILLYKIVFVLEGKLPVLYALTGFWKLTETICLWFYFQVVHTPPNESKGCSLFSFNVD